MSSIKTCHFIVLHHMGWWFTLTAVLNHTLLLICKSVIFVIQEITLFNVIINQYVHSVWMGLCKPSLIYVNYAPIIFMYANGSNKLEISNFWVTKTYGLDSFFSDMVCKSLINSWSWWINETINLLKPSGYFMYHKV